ncbi:MAG TPA: hypothetical protein VN784_12645 [Candidatus Limnocylindrales bacterium]|nr:hypothetical protein [Candidatus Limnocylindrales bacterium]
MDNISKAENLWLLRDMNVNFAQLSHSSGANLPDDVPQRRALAHQFAEGFGFHHLFLQAGVLHFQSRLEVRFNSVEVPYKPVVDFACWRVAFYDHGHRPCERLASGPQPV